MNNFTLFYFYENRINRRIFFTHETIERNYRCLDEIIDLYISFFAIFFLFIEMHFALMKRLYIISSING